MIESVPKRLDRRFRAHLIIEVQEDGVEGGRTLER